MLPSIVRAAGAVLALASASNALAQSNPIVAENALPGNPPSEWDITGDGDPSVQGFATDISVDQGGTIDFKIDTPAADYRIDIYRLGYYGGLGARYVATVEPAVPLPQVQPMPLMEAATRLIDCGNWGVSASWAVPADAVSGIYVAKLVREDPEDGRASHIVFVVRDDDGGSDILFQTSDTTWQAYNRYLGTSLYTVPRAYKVSYNRPVVLRGQQPWDWVFNAEYPMLRWLERNGYDVSYTTGVDTDRRGAEILEHRVFLSVGHDEYWSRGQREAVEAARDAGVHLAFLSGNEIYWKTRWEPSIDGSATPYRTLVCYKESHAGAKIDPLPDVWTGWWRDCRFTPPADGCEPENRLSGQISWSSAICSGTACGIQVPSTYATMRLWRHTDIASLPPGQVAVFPPATLGHEWDYQQYESEYPPGLVWLSSTTVSGLTHHLSLYRHASGAFVFGAGTIQWAWGLEDQHTPGQFPPVAGAPPDARMQQATVNLFAEMGVLPATLQSDLTAAVPSNDSLPPVSTIEFPAAGDSLLSGLVEIRGTAADAAGAVGAVEVSTDGGTTWKRASGLANWTCTWIAPPTAGPVTLLSRAADDLGNLEVPGAGVTVTVVGPPIEIAGVNADDSLLVNGVDVAHLAVVSRCRALGSDSLVLRVSLASNLGDRFEIGTETFALVPGTQHTCEFSWPLPAAAHPWEFAVEAALFDGEQLLEVETRAAAFTGMVMTRAELQEAADLLVGTAGCLDEEAPCNGATVGAIPHLGSFADFTAAQRALCQSRSELETGDLLGAGVYPLAALFGAMDLVLEHLGQARPAADAIPSDLQAAVACHASVVAQGLAAAAAKPQSDAGLDTLAATVRAAFADVMYGYSNEVFARGPVDPRIGVDAQWSSRTSLALRRVHVLDIGASGVVWAHIGPEPLPLGAAGTNPHSAVDVQLRATGNGTVELGLLHRTALDATLWVRYEPIPVTAASVLRVALADTLPYPWGFALLVDTEGDGVTDEVLYPGGNVLSDAGHVAERRFRVLPNHPNPFNPSTTIRYFLPAPSPVTVTLHDVRGRVVETLFVGEQPAGVQHVAWASGPRGAGRSPASGVYLVRVATRWGAATQKLTLVR